MRFRQRADATSRGFQNVINIYIIRRTCTSLAVQVRKQTRPCKTEGVLEVCGLDVLAVVLEGCSKGVGCGGRGVLEVCESCAAVERIRHKHDSQGWILVSA